MRDLNIYIGYDSNETIAYHVLAHSILEKSTLPVKISPLNLKNLSSIFNRERNPLQSTEFSFSRFLVPYLSNYDGWSLFMDCDMLARADFSELLNLLDDRFSVMVCKHNYEPLDEIKFLGQVQTKYQKKNWSSFMLFNNRKCRSLTKEFVNMATGLELHQFKWLENEDLIGGLPLEWNWLVGEYPKNIHAKNVHFTIGGPYFDDYKSCDYADEWFATKKKLNFVRQK